jgi:hypothetical protein
MHYFHGLSTTHKGAVHAAVINDPPAIGIVLKGTMPFACDELLRVGLESNVVELLRPIVM